MTTAVEYIADISLLSSTSWIKQLGHSKSTRTTRLVCVENNFTPPLQDQQTDAQRLLAEAEALMAEIGSGDYKARQATKAAEALKQSEAGLATQGLKLRCDVNGCVIVPINANQYDPGLTGKVTCLN